MNSGEHQVSSCRFTEVAVPGSLGVEQVYLGNELSGSGPQALKTLIEGPSPCDDCWAVEYCLRRLACRDFVYYCVTGKVRHVDRIPLRKFYNKLFKDVL